MVAEENGSPPPPLPQQPPPASSLSPLFESGPPVPLPMEGEEESEVPRHPISMRVILSSHALPSDAFILHDVHYANAPSSIERIYTDVQRILSHQGFREIEVAGVHGILRVTSGREAPGVHVVGPGRVVLFSPVVWEYETRGDCDGGGEGVFREKVGKAARMGDWLVFVLALPGSNAPVVGGGARSLQGNHHATAAVFGGLGIRDHTPPLHGSEVVDGDNGSAVTGRGLIAPPPPPSTPAIPTSAPGEQPAASVRGSDAASRQPFRRDQSIHGSGTVAEVGSNSQGDGNPHSGAASPVAAHPSESLLVTLPLPTPIAQEASASIRSGSPYLNDHASGVSRLPNPPVPSQPSSVGRRGTVRSENTRALSVRSLLPVVSRAAAVNDE